MKKYLAILSALAAYSFAQAATNVPVIGSTDPENPTLLSDYPTLTNNSLLWKGRNGGINPTVLYDDYVRVDTDLTLYNMYPSGGGGPHNNANFLFDDGMTITLTASSAIGFNDWSSGAGKASYAMNYNFYTAAGDSATINLNAAYNVSLYCEDNNFTGSAGYTTYGNFGRKFIIGEGITMNAKQDFTLSGHNADLAISDSEFIVNGTLNGSTGVNLTDTIATLGATGTISGADYVAFRSGTAAFLAGRVESAGYVVLNGNITQAASGSIIAPDVYLQTGTAVLNGTVDSSAGTGTRFVVNSGNAVVSAGANVNVSDLYMAGGTITLASDDLSVAQISSQSGTSSTIDTTGGATLTVTNISTLNSNATVTIAGDVETSRIINNGNLVVEEGATLSLNYGNQNAYNSQSAQSLTIRGTMNVTSVTSSWHTSSFLSNGTILVDGGTLHDFASSGDSSGIRIQYGATMSVINGGSVITNSKTFFQLENASLTSDGTATIDVGGFMFANNRKNNNLTIGAASELARKPKLFAQGTNSAEADAYSHLNLTLLSGREGHSIPTARNPASRKRFMSCSAATA
ncbi:MAG: hypothetical protein IJI37_03020, partial [Opitutales bacterium]|nr:hypothetical protein [Opitutales bacterium]